MLRPRCAWAAGILALLLLLAGLALQLAAVFPKLMEGLAEQVMEGERPALLETGPYTYREYRPMEDVDFLDNGTRVSALNPKTYVFQRDMSVGPESDQIRTVNIPAVTVMQKMRDSVVASVVAALMRSLGEGVFITRTVGELLWGYEDALLKAAHAFIPELDDHFGLFYKANGTSDGHYVFFSGAQDYRNFSRTGGTSDQCNMINGTNGAFYHSVYRPMEDVDFLDNGTRVSALNPKTYVFQRDMSVGPESDQIRTVNIPAVTVMQKMRDSVVASMVAALMRSLGEGVFITRTVGELLWGYEDALLKAAHAFIPELDDHFGLFYKANGTSDGHYVFFSGAQDYRNFSRCNMINGTNGAFYHSVVSKEETLYMFSSDLCRSLYALYVEEVTVKGIPAYRFVPPSQVFANHTLNPDNAGFCVPAGNCLGSGLLNVSGCKQGAPIIMSSPHFYQADEKYVRAVVGMRPNRERHQTTIDINPNVVVNIPFILIGLGVLLAVVFVAVVCRQKGPESSAAEREPLLVS
ncbi:hypothetical protein CRUP_032768 [Coryphaenoides rupestris]|nr:hypothetical protein CRUP_032768 [Coryphaenoides rupestris]